MKRLIVKLSLCVMIMTLTACGLTITPAVPANITALPPASTRTPFLTSTPTSTPLPPTINPIYFRDDFDRKFQPGWTWLREIPDQWNLTAVPDSLQILTSRGSVNSETMTNILLRPAPAGDFQMETKLTFLPEVNYQFAGLIVLDDNDNFIQAGHAFCRGGGCVGKGLYMDVYSQGLLSLPSFSQPYKIGTTLILRLIRIGNNYIFEASSDGRVFYMVGEHESAMTSPQVGILAGQNVDGDLPVPALFDYFEITSPQ